MKAPWSWQIVLRHRIGLCSLIVIAPTVKRIFCLILLKRLTAKRWAKLNDSSRIHVWLWCTAQTRIAMIAVFVSPSDSNIGHCFWTSVGQTAGCPTDVVCFVRLAVWVSKKEIGSLDKLPLNFSCHYGWMLKAGRCLAAWRDLLAAFDIGMANASSPLYALHA